MKEKVKHLHMHEALTEAPNLCCKEINGAEQQFVCLPIFVCTYKVLDISFDICFKIKIDWIRSMCSTLLYAGIDISVVIER